MDQWEKWKIAPLPISADDAWKEMEKLLDDDSSDKIPMPILVPLTEEKRKKKRLIIWWFILLGILLISGIWLFQSNKSIPASFPIANKQNVSFHINKSIKRDESDNSKKMVETSNKEVIKRKNYAHINTEHSDKETNSEVLKKEVSVIDTNEKKQVRTFKTEVDYKSKMRKDENKKVVKALLYITPKKFIPFKKRDVKSDKQILDYSSIKTIKVVGNKSQLKNKIGNSFKSTILKSSTDFEEIKLHTKKHNIISTKKEITNEQNKGNINLTNKSDFNESINTKITPTKQNNNYPSGNIHTMSLESNIIKGDSTKRIVSPVIDTDSNFSNQQKDSSISKKIVLKGLSAGLQWSASLPMTDNNSNTEKQFIPGVWLTKDIDNKSSVTFSFNPFVMQTNSHFVIVNKRQGIGTLASNLKIDSSWYFFDSSGMHLDTSIQVNRVITLLQSFGYRVSLDYKYQIMKKWQLSLGVEYNKIVSAYINDKIIRVTDSLVAKDATTSNVRGSDLWNFFEHNYFSGKAAISYTPLEWLTISVGTHKSFKSITNNVNRGINPSSYFLNLRLRLWRKK